MVQPLFIKIDVDPDNRGKKDIVLIISEIVKITYIENHTKNYYNYKILTKDNKNDLIIYSGDRDIISKHRKEILRRLDETSLLV